MAYLGALLKKLSPLPIVDLVDPDVPESGFAVSTPDSCIKNWGKGKCADYYRSLAEQRDGADLLTQCPYGFSTLCVFVGDGSVAITALVPFPRTECDGERMMAKRHPDNKIAVARARLVAEGLRSIVCRIRESEQEVHSQTIMSLHEVRKLNGEVKRTAERLLHSSDVSAISKGLNTIHRASDLMSQMFTMVEMLANEDLTDIEADKPCELYPLFDKARRIYTSGRESARVAIEAVPFGYPGPVLACESTLPLIASVLVNNAIKYSVPGALVSITVRRSAYQGFAEVAVSNRSRCSVPLTEQVFAKGVRLAADDDGSGHGLFLAQKVARQHGGRIVVKSSMVAPGECECEFVCIIPERAV